MDRNKALSIIALTLSLVLMIGVVSATFKHSFTYLEFNTGSTTWKESDETRTSWSIEILNNLEYNTTEALPVAKVLFSNSTNATTSLPLHFNTWYTDSGSTWAFEVRLATKVNPGADDYAKLVTVEKLEYGEDGVVCLSLDSDGEFNVGNSTDADAYLEKYSLGAFDISYIGRVGSFSENGTCALSGYISVEVDDYVVSTSQSLMSVMPTLVSFACFGIALGFVSKVMRNR